MPDYPKAALKNLSDAKALVETERWDGAAYHAGFVVECTLNALLIANGGSLDGLPHNLSRLEDYVSSAGRGHGKRRISPTQSQILSRCGIKRWHPNDRYEAEFVHSTQTAKDWVSAAGNFYHSVKP